MERALVLGGGGVTGVAWEVGVLAGLAERGVDLSDADLVVGTSAGAIVGAQLLSGVDVEELYEAQLAARRGETPARLDARMMLSLGWAMFRARDPEGFRARVGEMALAARTMPEATRRAILESRLRLREWPARRLVITAVDAVSGEFVAFDVDSGVSLMDAVAASCAVPGVWPPVTIDGRRYIDGGMRSPANADLAAGYDRVVVLAPRVNGSGWIASVADQVNQLTGRTTVVAPDEPARRAIGRNVLDPARRAPAARAGHAQAEAAAGTVGELWGQ